MFARKTVFIIGAGCSFEYGLPVGTGLRSNIVDLLNGLNQPPKSVGAAAFSDAIQTLAEDHGDDVDEWRTAATEMARGVVHAPSIDRYLDLRQSNEKVVTVGKLAIVNAIADAEAQSSLTLADGALSMTKIKNASKGYDWLSPLFEQMQAGCDIPTIGTAFSNLTFICFNYDRCIEHYFFHAVQALCGLDDLRAAEALKNLTIYHPYGRIGRPPWKIEKLNALELGYGQEISDAVKLIELSKSIKTFTEKVDSDADITAMHSAILQADQLVFLGFSYLDQNMELLSPDTPSAPKEVFATTFAESDSNKSIAREAIMRLLRSNGGTSPYSVNMQHRSITAGNFMHDHANQLRR